MLVTRKMPFGKYEGRYIADLPGNYLTWFAREGFPKVEIGRLLALMHEIDHNGSQRFLLTANRMRIEPTVLEVGVYKGVAIHQDGRIR